MTAVTPEATARAEEAARAPVPVAGKGLQRGSIGLLGSTVLGIVQTAPAFSLAVTLGLLTTAVGLQSPALILLGFVPVVLVSVVERRFVAEQPDCGTVFVWVGRALGPVTGWLCAWGMIAASVLAMANLTWVTGTYAFLTIGADAAAASTAASVAAGCVWLAIATALAARGIRPSTRVQVGMLGFGLLVLAVFVVVALARVAFGDPGPQAATPSLSWFDPFAVDGSGALTAGLLLTVFLFWGWDGSAAVVEEATEGARTSRRAILLSAVALVAFYVVCAVAVQAYAGVGSEGIGLTGELAAADVLGAVGGAAVGDPYTTLMRAAVLTSAAGCLVAAMVPAARTLLSMAAHEALPARFARVDARTRSPVTATVVYGLAVAGGLVVLSLVSEDVFSDAVGAVVLLIALYYLLLGLAALRAFRGSPGTALAALASVVIFGWALVRNGRDAAASDYGATVLLGTGGVLVIAVAALLVGVVLVLALRAAQGRFFSGETFTPGWVARHAPDLADDLRRG